MIFSKNIQINPTVRFKKDIVYPFIEMSDVSCNCREPQNIVFKKYTSGVKFENGDTIIARIEPCLQNGKSFYVKNIPHGFGSTEFLVFRPKSNVINKQFLYYYLQTKYIRTSMISSMTGATGRQRVKDDIFHSLEIDIPNIITQEKIAFILTCYDDLIENNQKQIKLLEEAAMRIYKEWFVHLRFPGHETTKIVDGVPEGWVTKKLSEYVTITMGQSPKSQFFNFDKNGLPFHQGVSNFEERFVIDEVYSTIFTRIAKPYSILFSVRAPVGRINITRNKIVIGRGLAALMHKNDFQSYLYYQLKNYFFQDNLIGNGAIYASINKNELESLSFLIPNYNLSAQFEKSINFFDIKIDVLNKQSSMLKQARDKLLPKLMSGKIKV